MGSVITLDGIDKVILNLQYRNKKTLKYKFIQAVRGFYNATNTVETVQNIDPKSLIRQIWDINDNSAIKAKLKNLNSIKSSVNNDLNKLYDQNDNPDGVCIGKKYTFEMSEAARDDLLLSFTSAARSGGDIAFEKVVDVLNTLAEVMKNFEKPGQDDLDDRIERIKELVGNLSHQVGLTGSGVDADEHAATSTEEAEEVESEDVEEVEPEDVEEVEPEEVEGVEPEDVEEVESEDVEEVESEDVEEVEPEDVEEVEPEDVEEVEPEDVEEVEPEDVEEVESEDVEEVEPEDVEEVEPEDVEGVKPEEVEDVEPEEFEEVEPEEFEGIEPEDVEDVEPEEVEEVEPEEFEEVGTEDVEEVESEDQHINDAQVLSDKFDEYLGTRERFYNQYVFIPKGRYKIGSKKPFADELNEKKIILKEKYIGRFPVTNALFEAFVEQAGYKTTAETIGYGTVYYGRFKKNKNEKTGHIVSVWNAALVKKTVQGACWYQPFGPGSSVHNKKNHPVVQVSRKDAEAFASWVGKRLPRENEWEAAARTDRGYYFPWGNKWKDSICNIESNGFADTVPVDYYPGGVNKLDIFDLLGNVLEWTEDECEPPYSKVQKAKYYIAKGGSWLSDRSIRLLSRFKFHVDHTANVLGFRCMVDGSLYNSSE